MLTLGHQPTLGAKVARPAALLLLALGAALFGSREARAQWTTSGTNTTTTDNVGIGTTAPTDRLEINGNVANGGGLTISTSGNAKYRVGTVGTTVPNWGGQIINARFNQTAGNWTQDDTTLNSAFIKLDLRNFSYGNEIGFYRMAAAASNPSPDAAWSPMAQFKLDTGNILLAPNSGSVGVGTAAPLSQFHLHGSSPRFRISGNATDQNLLISFHDNNGTSSKGLVGYLGANGTGARYTGIINTGGDYLGLGTTSATPVYFFLGGAATHVMAANGNVGIGTTAPSSRLHVAGNITVDGNINAKYQDVAEWVPSTQKLAAGTVVVLDPERPNHVLASTASYDTAVAGVVSAQPGIALGEAGEGKALVATTGRVRARVDATRAPIKIGDLIVTSDVEGVGMKSEPVVLGGRRIHAPGTIIGKALEPLAGGTGEILVLLSLQ